jgi:RNA polymerase sigma factor (TIGR02999 family)
MSAFDREDATRVLLQLSRGEVARTQATNRLFELLYDQLHRLAMGLMGGERADHTLQPTALVNEAYVCMVNGSSLEWKDRAHFIGVAASVMRRVLVAHARRRGAQKRGGDLRKITLHDAHGFDLPSDIELLDLDRVLTKLAASDARAAKIVEYRIFGGMTVPEVAHVLSVSERTIYKDWHFAKLWLSRELAEGGAL